ncbi:MAG: Rpn family recombination-promoting nuclease/putative transposase [Cyanobacteria bacterium FC1]|nr:Rpn family recombination-promoting nuclease/putative transposase [Cyanobacteria bacterium FC1]
MLVYKLPQASREEIATMLGLTDLKQTRFYQDAFADGQEVGREEGREEGRQAAKIELIQPLADQGISPQNIAQILKLSLDEVEKVLQGSDR